MRTDEWGDRMEARLRDLSNYERIARADIVISPGGYVTTEKTDYALMEEEFEEDAVAMWGEPESGWMFTEHERDGATYYMGVAGSETLKSEDRQEVADFLSREYFY